MTSDNTPDTTGFLTPRQVAETMDSTARMVRYCCRQGRLPAVKLPTGRWVIDPRALDEDAAWIAVTGATWKRHGTRRQTNPFHRALEHTRCLNLQARRLLGE